MRIDDGGMTAGDFQHESAQIHDCPGCTKAMKFVPAADGSGNMVYVCARFPCDEVREFSADGSEYEPVGFDVDWDEMRGAVQAGRQVPICFPAYAVA